MAWSQCPCFWAHALHLSHLQQCLPRAHGPCAGNPKTQLLEPCTTAGVQKYYRAEAQTHTPNITTTNGPKCDEPARAAGCIYCICWQRQRLGLPLRRHQTHPTHQHMRVRHSSTCLQADNADTIQGCSAARKTHHTTPSSRSRGLTKQAASLLQPHTQPSPHGSTQPAHIHKHKQHTANTPNMLPGAATCPTTNKSSRHTTTFVAWGHLTGPTCNTKAACAAVRTARSILSETLSAMQRPTLAHGDCVRC